jgi:hypothetical protein
MGRIIAESMVTASLASSTALEIASAASDHAFGSYGRILLVNWRTGVELPAVRALTTYRNGLVTRWGQLPGAIHLAEEGIALPSPEARSAAESSAGDAKNSAAACALVVFGSGFGASAVRSLGTAIFAFRQGPPTRLFATVPDAISWLMRQVEIGVLYRRLVDACEELRVAKARPSQAAPL